MIVSEKKRQTVRRFRLRHKLAALVLLAGLTCDAAAGNSALPESFRWGGTDALGRILPAVARRKIPKKRQVAVFYWTWHYNFAGGKPYNNSEIIAGHPEARNDFNHAAWQGTPSGTPHFWGKPLFGYYTGLDAWVVARHAIMLADAGVDAIVFDCTNGSFTWMPAVEVLCETFQKLQRQGVNVPKIAFMLNFAPTADSAAELRQLYRDIYAPGRYRGLWFQWQGKPLIMAHPEALNPADAADAKILGFFTFRRNEPTYFAKDTPKKANFWGWCSVYPQTRFGTQTQRPGYVEEMTVSVAQNANRYGLCAMNDSRGGVFGRGYAKDGYTARFPMQDGSVRRISAKTPDAWCWGLNFQQQFDYAIAVDPDLIFVTGWNEWIAGRHAEWCGTPNAFPDQYLPEFSRDIEPAENAPGDNFYFQLCANIRRYKGEAGAPALTPMATLPPAQGVAAWRDIPLLFTDPADCMARNADGWQGCHYEAAMPPNELIGAKAAFDREKLYFYLQCASVIRSGTRLRLLLATGEDGWEGFDFVAERTGEGGFALKKFTPGKGYFAEKVADAEVCEDGAELVLAVPLAALNIKPDFRGMIQFKWSDEQNLEESALAFYTEGDTAPNGRFRYILLPEKRETKAGK